MKTILLAAGAAALALSAGAADAKGTTKKQAHKGSMAAIAGPSQPIPYAMLDEYLKASPKQRASRDWWSGTALAQTGTTAATSATTTPPIPTTATPEAATPPATPPAATTTPPEASGGDTAGAGSVNPSPGAPSSSASPGTGDTTAPSPDRPN